MNYKLRASKKYDIEVTYFRLISDKERQALASRLSQTVDTYIDSQMSSGDKRISFQSSSKKMLNEMNELAKSILSSYRRRSDEPIPTFSELVKMKIEQVESVKLDKAEGDAAGESSKAKMEQRAQLIDELRALTAMEVKAMSGTNLLIFADSRYVEDYQTEDKAGYFSLNAGYGGVYLGGNLEKLEYGTSPYLGLSFPLSTSTIAPRFLRNASITMGVFTKNLEGDGGKEISGPLVGRPFYLGLDYKLFQFVRFNAGGAILEEPELAGVEGLLMVILMYYLAYRRGWLKTPGALIGAFFLIYGAARSFVELFRQPDQQFASLDNPMGYALHLGDIGLSMGQVLSLPMVLIGGFVIWRTRRCG